MSAAELNGLQQLWDVGCSEWEHILNQNAEQTECCNDGKKQFYFKCNTGQPVNSEQQSTEIFHLVDQTKYVVWK